MRINASRPLIPADMVNTEQYGWVFRQGVIHLLVVCILFGWAAAAQPSETLADLSRYFGPTDAVLVTDPGGKVLVSKNRHQLLIPASTLKVFTALVALQMLGVDFRFTTQFYLDVNNNLVVKGYGDPLLISEVIARIAKVLTQKTQQVADIVLDDSYFDQPLAIPGVSDSTEPYDAPNGALCVNFNTVFFKTQNGRIVSAEPQTPLLPFALQRIQNTSLTQGRIVFSHHNHEITLYSGHLLRFFLEKEGLKINGIIRINPALDTSRTLIYSHLSPFCLEDIIIKMLEYSNNFTTNQLLIACGAHRLGPPGTLANGVQVAKQYARETLGIKQFQVVEGSGISRQNRISAHQMMVILEHFMPHRHLLRSKGRESFKTGNLSGISTRVGYIEGAQGGIYRYVVFFNAPGRSATHLVAKMRAAIP